MVDITPKGYLEFYKVNDMVNCYVIGCELLDYSDCLSPYTG